MKTGSSPVLANQKSKEGDWLPKTQHFYFGVKAEGCSASFACSVEGEKKGWLELPQFYVVKSHQLADKNHYLLSWVDFLIFGI